MRSSSALRKDQTEWLPVSFKLARKNIYNQLLQSHFSALFE